MKNIFETTNYQEMTGQTVCSVFDTMLRYAVWESEEDYDSRANVVTAAIFFAGLWQGAVVLECGEEQARFIAQRLMDIPLPERMDDDVRDAMGELINTVGGNLKSVLPPGVSLSMPSVLEGPDHAYRICGSNLKERFSFRSDAGPLWVTLVQVGKGSN